MPLEHDSPREGPVAQWVEVGEKLGVDSSATETYANPELSDGCDWYKCPLYGEDLRCYPEVSLMRCLGCLQVRPCAGREVTDLLAIGRPSTAALHVKEGK